MRTKRSMVWLHFVKLHRDKAKCNQCNRIVASKGGNTTNLMKHLSVHHEINLGLQDHTICYCRKNQTENKTPLSSATSSKPPSRTLSLLTISHDAVNWTSSGFSEDKVWLSAPMHRKLSEANLSDQSLEISGQNNIFPKVKLELWTSGHLPLGVVRKVKDLLADCNKAFMKINMAVRQSMVNLPERNREATYHSITLPEVFHNFDQQQPILAFHVLPPANIMNRSLPLNGTVQRDGENQGEKDEEKEKGQAEENQQVEKVEENVEEAGKGKSLKIKGEELEFKVRADSGGRRRLEKVVQQLVEEQLQALQLNVFDGSLQELRERVEKMERENKHQQMVRLQAKMNRLAGKFKAASQASENLRKIQEICFPPPPAANPRSSPATSAGSTFYEGEAAQWSALPQSPVDSVTMKEEVENFNLLENNFASWPESPEDLLSPMLDQTEWTTLVHSEDEAVLLKPDDITLPHAVEQTETNSERGSLIVDRATKLNSMVIRAQLRDCSDVVTSLYLAPPTKKSMLWMETGRVDKLFSLPAHPLWDSRLRKMFTRCLTPPVPGDLRKRTESGLDNLEGPTKEAASQQRAAADRAQLAQVSTMETGRSAPEGPSTSPLSPQGVKRKARDAEAARPMNDLTAFSPSKDAAVYVERCEVENSYLRAQLEDRCSQIRHLTKELKCLRKSDSLYPASPHTTSPPDAPAVGSPRSTQPEAPPAPIPPDVPPPRGHAKLCPPAMNELTPCHPEVQLRSARSRNLEPVTLADVPLRAIPKDLEESLHLLSEGQPDRYARLLFQNFITFEKYREWSKSVNWNGSRRKVALPQNLKESILKMAFQRFPRMDIADVLNIRNRINECLRTPRQSFCSKSIK